LSPDVASEICGRGIHLTGGGALLHRFDEELERRVGVKFIVPDEPMRCVVMGTAAVLAQLESRSHLLIHA
jgi:rod shape-determining protein MreB